MLWEYETKATFVSSIDSSIIQMPRHNGKFLNQICLIKAGVEYHEIRTIPRKVQIWKSKTPKSINLLLSLMRKITRDSVKHWNTHRRHEWRNTWLKNRKRRKTTRHSWNTFWRVSSHKGVKQTCRDMEIKTEKKLENKTGHTNWP